MFAQLKESTTRKNGDQENKNLAERARLEALVANELPKVVSILKLIKQNNEIIRGLSRDEGDVIRLFSGRNRDEELKLFSRNDGVFFIWYHISGRGYIELRNVEDDPLHEDTQRWIANLIQCGMTAESIEACLVEKSRWTFLFSGNFSAFIKSLHTRYDRFFEEEEK